MFSAKFVLIYCGPGGFALSVRVVYKFYWIIKHSCGCTCDNPTEFLAYNFRRGSSMAAYPEGLLLKQLVIPSQVP